MQKQGRENSRFTGSGVRDAMILFSTLRGPASTAPLRDGQATGLRVVLTVPATSSQASGFRQVVPEKAAVNHAKIQISIVRTKSRDV